MLGTAILTMIYQPGIDLAAVRRGCGFTVALAGAAAVIAAAMAVWWRTPGGSGHARDGDGLVMVTPLMTAPMKNNTAPTCRSRAKLASVSVPAAISPTQATAISADSRPTAFWIAAAIPLCTGSTADKLTAVSGVMVSDQTDGQHDHPGQQVGDDVESVRRRGG